MITCRGKAEEEKIAALAKLLKLDKSEVIRRAINDYHAKFQQDCQAFAWLEPRLQELPGSGRSDISSKRKELLADAFPKRAVNR